MDRRAWLRMSGAAAVGVGVGACGTGGLEAGGMSPRLPRLNLPLVRASWPRVIRTTVGLRPHRPAGFRMEAERFDAKTVIHNYGHGGAGLSLCWGTGALAAETALDHLDRRAAVIGAGAVGLAAARQLQRSELLVSAFSVARLYLADDRERKPRRGFSHLSGDSQHSSVPSSGMVPSVSG